MAVVIFLAWLRVSGHLCGALRRISTAAFAKAILAGETQPGVWFPEERGAVSDRRKLLQDAAEGTVRFELNRPPWALESNPVRVGMGMYW